MNFLGMGPMELMVILVLALIVGTDDLALGVDPSKQNQSNVGRPIRIVGPLGNGEPVNEILSG